MITVDRAGLPRVSKAAGALRVLATITAVQAMATTLFHWTLHPWTLHPWAMYAVVGLAIAYGHLPAGPPSADQLRPHPTARRAACRRPGRVIDVLAIFATLFGSAASLGLGALQIGSRVEILGWAGDVGNGILVAIIAVLTAAFVASAVSGVARGIQWLSNINRSWPSSSRCSSSSSARRSSSST